MFTLRVKEVLEEKGISMGRFSREANIPLNLVRRMVKDPTYQPRLDTLAKAARYLKVDASALYIEDNDGQEENPSKL
jgi:predicted transcriptional regulator